MIKHRRRKNPQKGFPRHLRRHLQLTNYIHLKHSPHMHKSAHLAPEAASPSIGGWPSLKKTRPFMDPSTSPPRAFAMVMGSTQKHSETETAASLHNADFKSPDRTAAAAAVAENAGAGSCALLDSASETASIDGGAERSSRESWVEINPKSDDEKRHKATNGCHLYTSCVTSMDPETKHEPLGDGKLSSSSLHRWDSEINPTDSHTSLMQHINAKVQEGYLEFLTRSTTRSHSRQGDGITSGSKHSAIDTGVPLSSLECLSNLEPKNKSTRRNRLQKGHRLHVVSASPDALQTQDKWNWRSSELEMESAELNNDELDISELPQNGCGGTWNWSNIHGSGKCFLDMTARNAFCGASDTLTREMDKLLSRGHMTSSEDSSPITTLGFSDTSFNTESESFPLLDRNFHSDSGSPSGGTCVSRSTGHDRALELLASAKGRLPCDTSSISLCQKYAPTSFQHIVGQCLIIQALSNALSKKRVAPVYIFYGPRGTGKTSCARIFAMALNCISDGTKPCGSCVECLKLKAGKSSCIKEFHAGVLNGSKCMKTLKHAVSTRSSSSKYRVFIVEECHALSNQGWNDLMKSMEDASRNIVFILPTNSLEHIPDAVISRCQRFIFSKIKESEIIKRLEFIAMQEGFQVDADALKLIASTCDGSLRDAETMLDQLSLLGHQISLSMAQELMGLIPDEKLVDLLDFALSADTVNTVRNMKELMVSGVEPLNLVSQLACLITRILAGGYHLSKGKAIRKFFQRKHLTKEDMGRLRQALKILLEAEKQLRVSSDRTTWLTAALLQFAPDQAYIPPNSSADTSFAESPEVANASDRMLELGCLHVQHSDSNPIVSEAESGTAISSESLGFSKVSSAGTNWGASQRQTKILNSGKLRVVSGVDKNMWTTLSGEVGQAITWQTTLTKEAELEEVWQRVLDAVHSNSLRKFLQTQGKLISLSLSKGFAAALLEFNQIESNQRAERSRTSIAHAFQATLGYPVDVKVRLASAKNRAIATSGDLPSWQQSSYPLMAKNWDPESIDQNQDNTDPTSSNYLLSKARTDHGCCTSSLESQQIQHNEPSKGSNNRIDEHLGVYSVPTGFVESQPEDGGNTKHAPHQMHKLLEVDARSVEFSDSQVSKLIKAQVETGKAYNIQASTCNDDMHVLEDRLENAWVETTTKNEKQNEAGVKNNNAGEHVLSLGFVIREAENSKESHKLSERCTADANDEIVAKLGETLRLDSNSRGLFRWRAADADDLKSKVFQDIPNRRHGFPFSLCTCAKSDDA